MAEPPTGARLDHVLLAVRDLDEAGTRILDEHGLGSVPGGVHPGWGTANRIVPLRSGYLELVAVVDQAEAAGSLFGRWVTARLERGEGLLGWCVAVEDIEQVAARLGAEPLAGGRRRPDGTELRWRTAGLDSAVADPSLPFFIEWDLPEGAHPQAARAEHRVEPWGFGWLEVAGDEPAIRRRLSDARMDLRVVDGEPGPVRVVVATDDGERVVA